MSAVARLLIGAAAELTIVTGTLSGTGTLSLPAGVGLVTLTGQGGTGGDNSWYDPGHPEVQAVAGQAYVAAYYEKYWGPVTTTYIGSQTTPPEGGMGMSYGNPVTNPQYDGEVWDNVYWAYSAPNYYAYNQHWVGHWVYHAEVPYIAPVAYQPYVPPSSGGGPYTGPSTTATLAGVTATWAGGYGAGGAGISSVQTLSSTGAGQTLSYSVGAGGSLSYSYSY